MFGIWAQNYLWRKKSGLAAAIKTFVCANGFFQARGVTPFLSIMFPYLAVSPLMTIAKACLARS